MTDLISYQSCLSVTVDCKRQRTINREGGKEQLTSRKFFYGDRPNTASFLHNKSLLHTLELWAGKASHMAIKTFTDNDMGSTFKASEVFTQCWLNMSILKWLLKYRSIEFKIKTCLVFSPFVGLIWVLSQDIL